MHFAHPNLKRTLNAIVANQNLLGTKTMSLQYLSVEYRNEVLLLVTQKRVGNRTVFLCDICGLGYADRKTAQECEDYCRAHAGSCSAEISKKAVYLPGAPILPSEDDKLEP